MKKLLLVSSAAIALSFSSAKAAIGWFQDYVTVSIDGGSTQFYWIGSNPNFGTEFNGANFGSLTNLTFGVDMKYWASSPDTRDGGAINVSINDGPFTEYIWSQASIGGNDYQGTLAVTTINVTSGLSAGTHKVEVYAKTWGTGGDSFLSANPDYSATFTVVPEPSTYALLALSGAALGGYMVRRRRRA